MSGDTMDTHIRLTLTGLTNPGTAVSWVLAEGWGLVHVFLLPLSTPTPQLLSGAPAWGCGGPRSPSICSAPQGQGQEFLHHVSVHMCPPPALPPEGMLKGEDVGGALLSQFPKTLPPQEG